MRLQTVPLLIVLVITMMFHVQVTISPSDQYNQSQEELGTSNVAPIPSDPLLFDGHGFHPIVTNQVTLKGYDVVKWSELPIAEQYDYPDDALVPLKNGKLQVIYPDLIHSQTPYKSGNYVDQIDFRDSDILASINWEPDFVITKNYIPNDPRLDEQWVIDTLNMTEVWDTQKGGTNVLVAILDTGVDYNHPDLTSNYLDIGYDFVNNDNDVMDDDGHGTHVAGSIAATIDNGVGIAGLANVTFFSEKILDETGSGIYSDAIDGIYDAVSKGAKILSNSWGGPSPSQALQDAVNYAVSQGALFIAAAGNDASSDYHYPAALDNVIAVTSTDVDYSLSSFSNYGDWVDISAPGSNILSTLPNNNYAFYSGTSMATPHVSAVAALIWSQYPGFSNTHVQNQLLSTAVDIGAPGFDIEFGYGLVSPLSAMAELDDYDLDLSISQESYDETSYARSYDIVAVNMGGLDLEDVNISISINNTQYEEISMISISSGESYIYSITIDEGWSFYNISVFAPGYLSETNLGNNYQVLTPKYSRVLSPNSDDTIDGGLVLLEVQTEQYLDLLPVDMILNGDKISTFYQANDHDFVNFPVFSTGINTLTLHYQWKDGTFITVSVDVHIQNLDPLAELSVGDEINWLYDYSGIDGTYQQQHWTVVNILNAYEVQLALYVNSYNDTTMFWEYFDLSATIDIRNGYYVETDFGWDGQRFSWITNIENSLETGIFAGFFDWNHIIHYNSSVVSQDRIQVTGDDHLNGSFVHHFPTGLPSSSMTPSSNGSLESTTLLQDDRLLTFNQDINTISYDDQSGIELQINNDGDLVESILDLSITQNGVELEYELEEMTLGQELWPGSSFKLTYLLNNYEFGNIETEIIMTTEAINLNQTWSSIISVDITDEIAPIINIEDTDITVYAQESVVIDWIIIEPNYDSHQVYIENEPVKSGYDNNTITLQKIFTELGEFNITLEVLDLAGNQGVLTIFVNVVEPGSTTDTTLSSSTQPPNISSPPVSQGSSTTPGSPTDGERPDPTDSGNISVNILVISLSITMITIISRRKSNTG